MQCWWSKIECPILLFAQCLGCLFYLLYVNFLRHPLKCGPWRKHMGSIVPLKDMTHFPFYFKKPSFWRFSWWPEKIIFHLTSFSVKCPRISQEKKSKNDHKWKVMQFIKISLVRLPLAKYHWAIADHKKNYLIHKNFSIYMIFTLPCNYVFFTSFASTQIAPRELSSWLFYCVAQFSVL